MSQLKGTEPDKSKHPAESGKPGGKAGKPDHRGGAKTSLHKGHPDTGEKGEKQG